jgi:hypothetical protein
MDMCIHHQYLLNILLSLAVVEVVMTEVAAAERVVIGQTFLVKHLVVTQAQKRLYR